MFVLSVVDKDNNKLELLSSRSQVELDNFTTCFLKDKALLRELNLDPVLYRVIVENTNSKQEINFTPSLYRNVVYLYKNAEKENELIDKAINTDIDELNEFFLNELLKFDKDTLSRYDNERLESLNKIIYYFDTEEDKLDTQHESLKKLMKSYLYQNYSNLKDLFKYLTLSGVNFGQEYDKKTQKEVIEKLNTMKSKIEKVKDFSSDKFIDGLLPKYKEDGIDIGDDEEDILSFYHRKDYDDEETAKIDLEIYMDHKGFDSGQKEEFVKKHIKK